MSPEKKVEDILREFGSKIESRIATTANQGKTGNYEENGEVDISLIMINLRLSYEERIKKHDDALRFMQELKNAGRTLRQEGEKGSGLSVLQKHEEVQSVS